jgi:hypothetical protein
MTRDEMDVTDPERFPRKACSGLDPGWRPVCVRKTRQIKNLEPRFDSIETEQAPVRESSSASSDTNVPLEAKQSLAHGDRVRMSALGRALHPRSGDPQGLIRRTAIPEQLAGQVRPAKVCPGHSL